MIRRKPTYTVKMHAYRLSIMIDQYGEDVKRHCPASRDFGLYSYSESMWINKDEVHTICMDFIGLSYVPRYPSDLNYECPCSQLGCEIAVRKTIKALDKYYKGGD